MLKEWVATPKGTAKGEEHLKSLLVLAFFGLILGLFVQLEQVIIATMPEMPEILPTEALPTGPLGITLPAGMEMFYFAVVFIGTIISYFVITIIAKTYFALERIIKL